MAVADNRQRYMPLPEDRENGLQLAVDEAILIKGATNNEFKVEVTII